MDKHDQKLVLFTQPSKVEKIVINLKKGAEVRLSNSQFLSENNSITLDINTILSRYPEAVVSRTFGEDEESLKKQTDSLIAELNDKSILPLSGFYDLTLPNSDRLNDICNELASSTLVEEVYIEPYAVPALFFEPILDESKEAPTKTPSFISRQGYLQPSPEGINAYYGWTKTGGKGDKVQVIDIEGGWNFNHEDLVVNHRGLLIGKKNNDQKWENHGTAVHGVVGGDENERGIVGIVPLTKFGAASIFFGSMSSPARAIKLAADQLNKGDIILIELHRQGPRGNGRGQSGYIAIEWWSADYAAIKYATAKGIIVISAAGNGGENLDDKIYNRRFDRNFRDSGSILVGAGAPPSGKYGVDRSRLSFSNFGSCIDAQGWGREVTTTGYGDLQGGKSKNKIYTASFAGTSSASPIVVGAVACLQSIVKSKGDAPLSYIKIRDVLRSTGSIQGFLQSELRIERIGNRPDIKAALSYLYGN